MKLQITNYNPDVQRSRGSDQKRRRIQNLLTIVFSGFLLLSLALPAQAALVPCGGCDLYNSAKTICMREQPACQFCHVFVLTNNLVRFLLVPDANLNSNFPLVPTVAAVMFMVGGFYMLTAAGRPDWFNKAKTIITATVIGLLIVFVAWIFLNTLLDALGVAEWTGLKNWWQINCPI